MPTDDAQHERMQCMKVWGGNEPIDTSLSMVGLDAWLFSQPAEDAEKGGDVHYVSSCATGRITRMMLADVSGHGEAAAKKARGLRALMQRYINYIDQSRLVETMNRRFGRANKMGEFATSLVVTYFAPTGSLQICNAGHPAPLHFSTREQTWRLLPAHDDHDIRHANLPLGIEESGNFDHFKVELAVDDLVLLFTDAATEARDAQGQQLGQLGLLKLVEQLATADPAALLRELLDRLRQLDPANLRRDDLTILLFRPNGQGPPMINNLLGPFHYAKDLWSRMTSKSEATGDSP